MNFPNIYVTVLSENQFYLIKLVLSERIRARLTSVQNRLIFLHMGVFDYGKHDDNIIF